MKLNVIDELINIVRENKDLNMLIKFENGNDIYTTNNAEVYTVIRVLEALGAIEEIKFVIVKDKALKEE